MQFWSCHNSWIFCLEGPSITWLLPTLNGFISYYFSLGYSEPFVLFSTYQIRLFVWNFEYKMYSLLSSSLSPWQKYSFFKSDLKHLTFSAFLWSSCIPLLQKLFYYIIVVPTCSPIMLGNLQVRAMDQIIIFSYAQWHSADAIKNFSMEWINLHTKKWILFSPNWPKLPYPAQTLLD